MRRFFTIFFILLLLSFPVLGLKVFRSHCGVGSRISLHFATDEALATEQAGEEAKDEAKTAKEDEAEHGEEGEAEEEHHGPPPLMYFVQWLILLTAFGLGLRYARKVRTQGRSHHEGIKLAHTLTILVLLYFGLSYYPTLAEYHEPGLASLLKFLLLLITGALVTFYGVLGRHEEH